MPSFPLKSVTTLGALLGLGYSDESEAGWIGPKGFNRLFKSSGLKNPYGVAVEKAELLEKAGHSPQEIFDKTQLIRHRVLGGKWIGAISDTGAKFSEHWPLDSLIENPRNAQEIYNHPELYEAYPQFKKLPITLTNITMPAHGLYLPYPDIRLRDMLGRHFGIIDVAGHNKPSIEQVLSHEFGHAIQDVEKWPRGGSPENAKTQWTDYAGPAVVKLLSEGKINDADNLLQRFTEINEGTDYDAYMDLGGEVLSWQNEHLRTRTNAYPDKSLGTNVAAIEPLGSDKPLGYILPEYAKTRLISPSGLPSPLGKESYEILAESYHKITDPDIKSRIGYLLNQYAPDIQKQYNLTPDEFLDRFSKKEPTSSRFSKLPAVGVAGSLNQYADYNIGEAKPTNVFQETWQTNPVGQAVTGFMRSPLETGAEMLNETQKMGSEFYGLPEQQTGTKILKYLEQEGAIPRKTGSTWEVLGGLLGL